MICLRINIYRAVLNHTHIYIYIISDKFGQKFIILNLNFITFNKIYYQNLNFNKAYLFNNLFKRFTN